MSYVITEPIDWIPFDPPGGVSPREPSLAHMRLGRGLIAGPGLEQLLGPGLFDRAVDEGFLEPIP